MYYTVKYASRRDEIWRWYWRAWKRPAGLWRYHVMFGLVAAFIFTVLLEPHAFHLARFLTVAVIVTVACVVLFPLWPQLRFKSAVRTLTINADGLETTVGAVSGSRPWKDIRSIEESEGSIVITGNNKNAFVVPDRAFATGSERQQFFEAARKWHSPAFVDRLPLHRIEAVTFYKRDELTTDLICCDVRIDGETLFFHEETEGWELLIKHLGKLPGFRTDWYAAVSQPPFALSEIVAFSRK